MKVCSGAHTSGPKLFSYVISTNFTGRDKIVIVVYESRHINYTRLKENSEFNDVQKHNLQIDFQKTHIAYRVFSHCLAEKHILFENLFMNNSCIWVVEDRKCHFEKRAYLHR